MAETTKAIYRVHINAPIQTVWDQITRTGEPLPFFFNSVMHTQGLAAGASIRMRTKNGKYTGVVGDVLIHEPPYRFSHTFKFTQLDDPPCRVTYELVEKDTGVEFTLMIDDLPTGTKTQKYMTQGGLFITETLKALLETGRPPLKSRLILLMCRITEPLTPKRALSSNWP